jgi:hypothetical protein
MKVIIAGGRDFIATPEDRIWLIEQLTHLQATEVVSGKAKGADSFGEQIANELNIPIIPFPADWNKYPKVAGFIRNKAMANYADAVILFKGGKTVLLI